MFFLFIPVLQIKGKKIFWTMHDVNLRPSNRGLRGKLDLLFTCIVSQPWFLGRCADVILVQGTLLRSQLATKGVNEMKVYLIPHFDHRYLLKSVITPIPRHNTLPEGYILLFGKIAPYKGIEVLIDAARIVKRKLACKR